MNQTVSPSMQKPCKVKAARRMGFMETFGEQQNTKTDVEHSEGSKVSPGPGGIHFHGDLRRCCCGDDDDDDERVVDGTS